MTMQPLDPEHPVMRELAYLRGLINRNTELLTELQRRGQRGAAALGDAIGEQLVRRRGRDARETPGASTGPRT